MEWTKYVLACTLGVCMLILFGRRDEGRDKWIFGLAVGGSLAAMELTVEYMYHKELWVMASSVMKSLALFSLIVLAGYGWEWIRSHKREDNEQEPVHPVRQWIEEYQESFAQLSRSFCMTPQMTPVTDRGELLFQRRLAENRIAAAGQIREMGSILEGAMERIYGTKEDVPLEQEIGKRLRFMGITLIQVFFYSPGGRKRQVYVTMHTKRKICVPVKKVAAVLSELTDCEMMPARDSRTFVSQEKVTVLFVEATAYQVLYGIKKVTKPGEAVSGDNFSVFWLPEGRFVAGLSDGMGSGLQACGQSETVLDLIDFDGLLEGTDLVVTGEGRIDWQSAFGKVPSGIGMRCKAKGVPAVAIVGGMGNGAEKIYDFGVESIIPTINGAMDIEEALERAEELYANAADRTFRMIRVGMQLK